MPNYAQAAIQLRQNKERRAKGKESKKLQIANKVKSISIEVTK